MSLSSLQLDAFFVVAQTKSFSQAADQLHVTQSALSQRILNLEDELGTTLFIRESTGVRMTDLGQRLLKYCHARSGLEGELLQSLKNPNALAGILRIGGFSSIMRSLVLPKLTPLLKKNPLIQLEVLTKEMRELPDLLRSGQADFIFTNHAIEKQEYENVLVGYEENVLIESKNSPDGIYIDHDEHDTTTADFLKLQKSKEKYQRFFFDEIYAIIDGVEAGLGRAVVPEHLIKDNKDVKVVAGLRSLRTPIYLVYFRQAIYPKLQTQALLHLKDI